MNSPAVEKDEIWETRDHRLIPVGEMSEEHVRAALRLVLRRRRLLKERSGGDKRVAMVIAFTHRLRAEFQRLDAMDAEAEQRFHDELMNDVMEDKKWGSS